MQAWYSQEHPGRSPYRLYALSNVASLNAAVGVALATQVGKVRTEKRTEYWALIGFQTALLAALVVCLTQADVINKWFL